MSVVMSSELLDEPLFAVEHHRFKLLDQWLLFGVNTLAVLPSCATDEILMAASSDGITSAERIAFAVQRGHSKNHAEERLRALIERGFLVSSPAVSNQADLAPMTRHATFMINVSQRCNLTCPYCYVHEGHFDYEVKPIAKMRMPTAETIVDSIHEHFPGFLTYCLHFYGGEPLLNFKAIQRIVQIAEAKAKSTGTHIDFHITTNGTLLDRAIADFMDEHKFTVYFSIDGDKQNHDSLRKYRTGEGSFEQVERNLEYLKTRPRVHLIGSSVVRPGFSLKSAMNGLADHGAVQCKAERVRLPLHDPLALSGIDHDSYLDDLGSLTEHYIESLEHYKKPMDFRLSSKILQLYTRKRRNFFCPAGQQMFGISADGEIYPCALHVGRPQSFLGDLVAGLDRDRQHEFRLRYSPDQQDDCRTCWSRALCGGGCSAMVDRFGKEDCEALRKESEAAIAVYQYFQKSDPLKLIGLVSPKVVQWANGDIEDPDELALTEPASDLVPDPEY